MRRPAKSLLIYHPPLNFKSPAAVYSITNEDLHRSGVTNIPDALRMVPGLTVARIDSNKWSVSSRGPGTRFFSRLLVMIDGRIHAKYTPWPATAFNDPSAPIELCVFGNGNIRKAFATIEGKAVGARKLHVRFLELKDSADTCHMMFIGKSVTRARQTQLLSGVSGRPVRPLVKPPKSSNGEVPSIYVGKKTDFFLKSNLQPSKNKN